MVHRGRHLGLDVDVAVKILDADAGDPSAIERALAEARLMAKLDHPNVLRIHDAGRAGSVIYLVLEIMDGGNCSVLRRVSPARGLELARQLLAGIQALHEARIIHRDIKPANCLLRTRDGRVKLADLGIAVEQVTREGLPEDTAGTLPFMAPELFDQPPRYSEASDLYALGMTLACLFLEENPFPSGPVAHLLGWIRGGERPRISLRRPDMPHELTSLVDRLLAIDPSRRPSSASEALASLGQVIRGPSPSDVDGASNPSEILGPWIIIRARPTHESIAELESRPGRLPRPNRTAPGRPLAPGSPVRTDSENSSETGYWPRPNRPRRLDHPGVLDVIDWGVRDGQAYLVTLPLGRPLHSLVESGGPIDEAEAVDYAVAIAEALAYLHAKGLVYQIVDTNTAVISPDARTAQLGWPMFCRPAGSPSVDEEGQSQRAFVPKYAAPEAFETTQAIETPGDVYGLGEILFIICSQSTAYPATCPS